MKPSKNYSKIKMFLPTLAGILASKWLPTIQGKIFLIHILSTSSYEYFFRYESFKKLNEKKQVFNAYKTQKIKDEKEEQRNKAKKSKELLEQFLLNSDQITSCTKYYRCDEMFSYLEVGKVENIKWSLFILYMIESNTVNLKINSKIGVHMNFLMVFHKAVSLCCKNQ